MKKRISQDDLAEMEAAVERLREEIRRLQEQRDALEQGNLELYRKLTDPDF
jgi:cell division protein FtsB